MTNHEPAAVILMCGLPASGKTTMAARLHARFGGALIRQCDVYRSLGIDLRGWVRRTARFTHDVESYERVRDGAYAEMRRQIRAACTSSASPIIVDAVHGERVKRLAVYTLCYAHRRR